MERLAIEAFGEVEGGPVIHAKPAMNSVEHLIVRARGGDEEAFRLIFERYSRPIISFIYDMVNDRAHAEELTQETFVRAHHTWRPCAKRRNLRRGFLASPRTWRASLCARRIAAAKRSVSTMKPCRS